MNEWLGLVPVFVAAGGAVLGLGLDALSRPVSGVTIVVLACLGAFGLSGWLALQEPREIFGVFAAGAGFSGLGALVYLLAAVALLAGMRSLTSESNGANTAALIAFSAAAAGLLMASFDLLALVMVLEAVALTGYALVSAARTPAADEAAMKYFVQGAVATGLLLYGFVVVYGMFGGRLFLPDAGLSLAQGAARPAVTAFVLLLSAFAFKLGAFPFHSWAPDAYQTAPPFAAAFLASAPKLAALVAAFVLFPSTLFSGDRFAQVGVWLFAALAAASIVFGNLGGLKQVSFTRMLGYSGIAQVGYALVGLAAVQALAPGLPRASFPLMLFGAVYAVAAAGGFIAAEAVGRMDSSWDGTVSGMAGLGRRRPMLAAGLTICLLSLTGIPLTAGFWGKFLVFGSAVAMDLTWLAVVGVLGSVVSFGYYGGVVRSMYLDLPVASPAVSVGAALMEPAPDRLAEAMVVLAALIVLGVGTAPLFFGLDFLVPLVALPL